MAKSSKGSLEGTSYLRAAGDLNVKPADLLEGRYDSGADGGAALLGCPEAKIIRHDKECVQVG